MSAVSATTALVAGFSQTFSLSGEDNPYAALFDGHDELRFDDEKQLQTFLQEEGRLGQSPGEGVSTIVGEFRRFI